MTVASTPLRKETTGNGVGLNHPYDWKIDNKNELLVTRVTIADSTETTLTVDSDYTVTGVGDAAGGNVVISPALTSAYRLVITSNADYDQASDFTNQASVPPEEVEDALDQLSRQVKQIVEILDRTVKITVGSTNNVETYLEDCQAAQAAAETAQTNAETAETAAETAQGLAEDAQAAAEAAAANAEVGDISAAATVTPTLTDFAVFADVSDSNNPKKATWANVAAAIAETIAAVVIGTARTFTGGQRAGQTAITSTSNSIAIDFSNNNDFTHTLTENTTLANPSNLVAGQSGAIHFTQDASTAYTLAYGSYWDFQGGTAPDAPDTLSSRFTLYYHVRSSTQIEAVLSGEYS